MTDTLSLGPVLDLIERWQQAENTHIPRQMHSGYTYEQMLKDRRELMAKKKFLRGRLTTTDIPAYRQLAEQHAAQLRELTARMRREAFAECTLAEQVEGSINAAANFLVSPRREPEAE